MEATVGKELSTKLDGRADVRNYKKNHLTYYLSLFAHRTHKNKPITFDGYEYMRDIYLDTSRNMVIMKSTQNGVSEYLICRGWSRAYMGKSVFWVLPTFTLKNTFVADRFERSIEYSKVYRGVGVSNAVTKIGKSDSRSLKHIRTGSINFVGSGSTSAFTSYPADDVYIDEKEECVFENLEMAPERQDNSDDPYTITISNPKFEGDGIDLDYASSDQKKWIIKCNRCGKYILMDWFEHVVREIAEGEYVIRDKKWDRGMKRDIQPICNHCERPFNRKVDGVWIPHNVSDVSGYHISKLFSGKRSLSWIMDRFEKGLSDDPALQRFYNADLGVPYTASGSKITYPMLDRCCADYRMPSGCEDFTVMGADVGNKQHVIIAKPNKDDILQSVFIGGVESTKDIVDLKRRYNVKCGVIDSQPELEKAKDFVKLGPGFWRCFYFVGEKKSDSIDKANRVVTVDRTGSLDSLKTSIVLQKFLFPKNSRKLLPLISDGRGGKISELFAHMGASVRVYDEKGRRYVWKEGSKPDHLFHAANYCKIAYSLLSAYR